MASSKRMRLMPSPKSSLRSDTSLSGSSVFFRYMFTQFLHGETISQERSKLNGDWVAFRTLSHTGPQTLSNIVASHAETAMCQQEVSTIDHAHGYKTCLKVFRCMRCHPGSFDMLSSGVRRSYPTRSRLHTHCFGSQQCPCHYYE